MEFFPLIILAYFVTDLLLSCLTIKFSIRGLQYQRKLAQKTDIVSPMITVYFIYMLLYAFIWLIYSIYMTAFWRPIEIAYNAKLIFWFGLPWALMTYLNSIMEACLALDRCITFVFPLNYNLSYKKLASAITIVILLFTFVFVALATELLNNIPTTTVTDCYYLECTLANINRTNTILIKCFFALINIFCGILLFIIFKVKSKKSFINSSTKNITKILLLIIFMNVFFDFVPVYGAQLLYSYQIISRPLSATAGPFASTLIYLSNTICVGIYCRSIKKSTIMLHVEVKAYSNS